MSDENIIKVLSALIKQTGKTNKLLEAGVIQNFKKKDKIELEKTNQLLQELKEEVKKKSEYEVEISPELKEELKGKEGEKGRDGKTPQRGIDYFTAKERVEFKDDIQNEIVPEVKREISKSEEQIKENTKKQSEQIAKKEIQEQKGEPIARKLEKIEDEEKRLSFTALRNIPKDFIKRVKGGIGKFLNLSDVFGTYKDNANKLVSVKGDESGLEFSTGETILNPIYVRRDGTLPLTANWNAGDFKITSGEFHLDDNKKATFGNKDDGEVFVDSNDNLYIRNITKDKDIILSVNDNGSQITPWRVQGSTGYLIGSDTSANDNIVFRTSNGSTQIQNPSGNAIIAFRAYGGQARFNAFSSNGTISSPTASQSGDILFKTGVKGYGATGFPASNKAEINIVADENWTDTAQGTRICFETTENGTTSMTEKMCILGNGNVGLGTSSPQAQLHTTKGRIVKVDRYTSTQTLDADNHQVFGDTDGGAFTINLPAGIEGTYYRIVNTGSSGNNLTITPNGLELLLGVNASFNLADGESLIIVYHPTEGWF